MGLFSEITEEQTRKELAEKYGGFVVNGPDRLSNLERRIDILEKENHQLGQNLGGLIQELGRAGIIKCN